jgi:DNA-binding MarR family transcriptional regulator
MAPAPRRSATTRVSAKQIDAVMRASRALVGIAAASIAEVDDAVTLPQLRVLVMVSTRGPMNLAAVAAGLEVSASNASRICDRLMKARLLDRREDPTDRRNVTLTITDRGQAIFNAVTQHRRSAIERVLRNMDARQREQLVEVLDTLSTAAGEPVDENLALIRPRSL